MTVHTVAPGESVWFISQKYRVPIESIAVANGLTAPYNLVVGQSLFIPQVATTHVVRPGESLWSIARRYNVSVDAIADINNIPPNGILIVGQTLIIPAKSNYFGTIEVNAYIEPSGNPTREMQYLTEALPHLTYVSIFSYRAQEDGSIISPPNDQALIDAAKLARVAPLMVITNFAGGTFSTDLAHTILTNIPVQEKFINNVVDMLKAKGFSGLNVDFERVPPADRDAYTGFLIKLRDRIKPQGYSLSVALAPKQSATQIGAWYEAHDYGAIGSVADFVMLMTYEWGWSGGPPLAVAPIDQVMKVLNYAVTVIPPHKILMGVPLYGYDWVLPYTPGGAFAPRIDPLRAVQKAGEVGSIIQYDQPSQSPFYRYYDANGAQHIVWFEDTRSVLAKYRVVHGYRLRGVSYWVLGPEFPQNWLVLEDLFTVKKII
jgi:spore germination protein